MYRRCEDVVTRHVAGEVLLVPIRGRLVEMDRLFALNRVGEVVWQTLDGKHDVPAIRDAVVARFEVDPQRAETEVSEFLAALQAAGLITAEA